MKKAIFLYNDGSLLPEYFYDKYSNNQYPDLSTKEILISLKNLQERGYKIIHLLTQSNGNVTMGVRLLEFESVDDHSKKNNLIIREFYYVKSQEHSIEDIYKLLLKAANDLNIDLSNSWIIGNSLNDIEAGNNAGCYSILFDNGFEQEWFFGPGRTPNYFVKNFKEVLNNITLNNTINRNNVLN